ncbi:antibiotic biosynthesis monooxygenase family protein [Amycolatopsis sp. NPDC059021]|uniref:antibiotic biosynthesis monooxygenase family protein n=1 Tax=Amycolatopsis sp. NPDC059021 TaxID=3346704 RepID=UPI00366C372E
MSFTRPEPPYYAVVISSALSGEDPDGYAAMAVRMAELGARQPGYLGRESQTGADGRELTVLYYRDTESITAWQRHTEHLEAQRLGKQRWYADYHIEVARVERAYGFQRS